MEQGLCGSLNCWCAAGATRLSEAHLYAWIMPLKLLLASWSMGCNKLGCTAGLGEMRSMPTSPGHCSGMDQAYKLQVSEGHKACNSRFSRPTCHPGTHTSSSPVSLTHNQGTQGTNATQPHQASPHDAGCTHTNSSAYDCPGALLVWQLSEQVYTARVLQSRDCSFISSCSM